MLLSDIKYFILSSVHFVPSILASKLCDDPPATSCLRDVINLAYEKIHNSGSSNNNDNDNRYVNTAAVKTRDSVALPNIAGMFNSGYFSVQRIGNIRFPKSWIAHLPCFKPLFLKWKNCFCFNQ